MDRAQAEVERKRLATEQPDVTWLITERDPGDWAVVKLGVKPLGETGTTTEATPKRGQGDDPRTPFERNVGPWVPGL